MGKNINTIMKTETLTDASKEVGLEMNAEKTKQNQKKKKSYPRNRPWRPIGL
jgi:hypothetical protein